MKIHGNDIIIHRGETFTLSMNIKMRDGTPFIMTYDPDNKEAHNPYMLITVASSKYKQTGSYIKNFWLPMNDLPSFTSSEIQQVKDFNNMNSDSSDEKYLYFVTDANDGAGGYYYINDDNEPVEYKCSFSQPFSHEYTNSLVSQSYYYSVTYVDGPLNTDENGALIENEQPVRDYTQVTTIIPPSKLTVLSNLRGGL